MREPRGCSRYGGSLPDEADRNRRAPVALL